MGNGRRGFGPIYFLPCRTGTSSDTGPTAFLLRLTFAHRWIFTVVAPCSCCGTRIAYKGKRQSHTSPRIQLTDRTEKISRQALDPWICMSKLYMQIGVFKKCPWRLPVSATLTLYLFHRFQPSAASVSVDHHEGQGVLQLTTKESDNV